MAIANVTRTNSSNFLQPSIPIDGHVAHIWEGESVIKLIRAENQLRWEMVNSAGVTITGRILVPENKTVEQAIAHLITLVPVLTENRVDFRHPPALLPVPAPHIRAFRSQLDNNVIITNDIWAATLADNLIAPGWNPTEQGGHANIYIEKMENGIYEIHRADLTSELSKGGSVHLKQIDRFDQRRIVSQSVTWVRSKNLMSEMMSYIKHQDDASLAGHRLPFSLRGNGAIGVEAAAHNCFTWARETLKLGKIFLYEDPPSTVNTKAITLPKSCISQRSIYSKEKVVVQIEGMDSKFDVTFKFNELLRSNSWRLPTDLQGHPSLISRVRGRIDLTDYENPVKELDRVEIAIIEQNGQLQRVVATEIVKKSIESEVFRAMPLTAKKVDKFIVDNKTPEEVLRNSDRDNRPYLNRLTGPIMIGGLISFFGGAPVAVLYVATAVATAIEGRTFFTK